MNNKEILNEWSNSLSNYKKLKFNEAKQLYIEMQNTEDTDKKHEMMQELITGTLYVVVDIISKNGLLYLNSSSYDMSDIISTYNELWIENIKNGRLLEISTYSKMISANYISKFQSKLGIDRQALDYHFDLQSLSTLFMDYLKFIDKDGNINFDAFMAHANTNEKFRRLKNNKYRLEIIELFDAIVKTSKVEDLSNLITKNDFDQLEVIFISNALEYLKEKNRILIDNPIDDVINHCAAKQTTDFIIDNIHLDDSFKYVLQRRFGLDGEKSATLEELAKEQNVTSERIRQKEIRVLQQARYVAHSNELHKHI